MVGGKKEEKKKKRKKDGGTMTTTDGKSVKNEKGRIREEGKGKS